MIDVLKWTAEFAAVMDDGITFNYMRAQAIRGALKDQMVVDALAPRDPARPCWVASTKAFIDTFHVLDQRMKDLGIPARETHYGIRPHEFEQFEKLAKDYQHMKVPA